MTIQTFRIYYEARTVARTKRLTGTHWGFAAWFKRRLKPIKEQLRGPEVKGVDIVNLMLYEHAEHAWKRDEWNRRLNSIHFDFVCDLQPLLDGKPLENVEKLMGFAATITAAAPWPQVRALSLPLSTPLSAQDKLNLEPYLRWPRAESLWY